MIAVCPRCDKPMAAFVHKGVELDVCGDCTGIWLDEGEFAELADAAAQPDLPTDALLAELRVPGRLPAGRARLCPRCSASMEELLLPPLDHCPATKLDRCPKGHGLFFDPDELSQVLRRHHGPGSPLSTLLEEFLPPASPVPTQIPEFSPTNPNLEIPAP